MTLVDDGDGEVRVWRVEQLRLQPVSVALYGHFLSGDCFVVVYRYGVGGRDCIVYYWQGRRASVDEKATAALFSGEIVRDGGRVRPELLVPRQDGLMAGTGTAAGPAWAGP